MATNASKPTISIIIPVYNTERYLEKCLSSVVNQTYQNLEVIVINDGSTDSSSDIIKTFSKKDSRIKVINQENRGQSSARNAGLRKASSKYIAFIDSDDEISPEFISKLLEPYQKTPKTSLTICGFERRYLKTNQTENLFLNPASPKKQSDTNKSYVLRLITIDGRLYSVNNKLFIADIAKKLSFDVARDFAEDTKFVLDYLKKTNYELSFVLSPLYIYNFGSENSTINKSATKWINWQKSYQDIKNWLGKNPTPKEIFWSKMILLRWRISYHRSKARSKKSA